MDFSLFKSTPITEKLRAEFRVEIFNLTNTPPFGPPNTVLGSAAFGTITTAGDPRVVQLAFKVSF